MVWGPVAAPHSRRAVSSPSTAPRGCLLPVAATHVPARQLTPPWHAACSLGQAFRPPHPQRCTRYNLLAAWHTLRACELRGFCCRCPKAAGVTGCVRGTPQVHPAPPLHLPVVCAQGESEWSLQCSVYSSNAHHLRAARRPTRLLPPYTARWLCRPSGRNMTADASLRDPLTHFRV